MELPIILVGPMGAGKSTLAGALAKRLDLRWVPMDAVRFWYYLEDGYRFTDQLAQPNFEAVARLWEPYSIRAVERIVVDFADSVIDFGAGHAHYTDPDHVARLERAMAPLRNVIRVTPSEDPDRAEQISIERDKLRLGAQYDPSREPMARTFARSDVMRRIAKHTVVTGDRSVEASLDDLIALLS